MRSRCSVQSPSPRPTKGGGGNPREVSVSARVAAFAYGVCMFGWRGGARLCYCQKLRNNAHAHTEKETHTQQQREDKGKEQTLADGQPRESTRNSKCDPSQATSHDKKKEGEQAKGGREREREKGRGRDGEEVFCGNRKATETVSVAWKEEQRCQEVQTKGGEGRREREKEERVSTDKSKRERERRKEKSKSRTAPPPLQMETQKMKREIEIEIERERKGKREERCERRGRKAVVLTPAMRWSSCHSALFLFEWWRWPLCLGYPILRNSCVSQGESILVSPSPLSLSRALSSSLSPPPLPPLSVFTSSPPQ